MKRGPQPISAEFRFWMLVLIQEDEDSCWPWIGTVNGGGYGYFKIRPYGNVAAHRFAYELERGIIPDGLEICHRCDNPPCVRPSHLFAATHADNLTDSRNKGRLFGKKHIAAIRAASCAYRHSPEAKAKISKALKGRQLSAEHRRRIGDVRRGKKMPEEQKHKISLSLKGRKKCL